MSTNRRFDELVGTADGTLKQRAVRGGAYTMGSEALDFILRVGSIAILARLLIPEHFGLIGMVTAITAIAERFKDLGLSVATVQRSKITHEQISSLFWINGALGLGCALVVAALSAPIARFYHDDRLIPITLAIAVTFIWGGLTIQHLALLRRAMKFGHIAVITVGSSLLSIIVAVVMAYLDFGYWALVAREVVRSALLTLGTWACCRWVPNRPAKITGDVWSMLHFGGYLTVVQFAGLFSLNLGQILVGRYFGAHAVGMYRQGHQLVLTPITQLAYPIDTVSEAALSRLQSDRDQFRRYYRKLVTVLSFVTMPLMAFLAAFAEDVVRIFLGPEWSEATPIFRIMAIAAFLAPAVGTTSSVMVTCGHSRRYFFIGLMNASALVAFSFLGIRWGPAGIAAAHILAFYVLLLPRLHYSLRGTPVDMRLFFLSIYKPVIASLIMAAGVLAMSRAAGSMTHWERVGVGFLVGSTIYMGVWFVLPSGRQELRALCQDIVGSLRSRPSPPS